MVLLHVQTGFALNEKLSVDKDSFFPLEDKKTLKIQFSTMTLKINYIMLNSFLKTAATCKLMP